VLLAAGTKRLMDFMTSGTMPATTLKILLTKKKIHSVMKSFMVMKGDGVKR
jgi:hypothetical protein